MRGLHGFFDWTMAALVAAFIACASAALLG
jgi:hypothetical protein